MRIIVASSTSDRFELFHHVSKCLETFAGVSIIHIHSDRYHPLLADSSLIDQCHSTSPPNAKPDGSDPRDAAAAQLCDWADVLVLAPIDADAISRMLAGLTDTLFLQVLRSWNVSKRMLLVPAMSTQMWEHPLTKRQLSKIRRNCNWVRVLAPLLWAYPTDAERNDPFKDGSFTAVARKIQPWEGMDELVASIRYLIDLSTIGHGIAPTAPSKLPAPRQTAQALPPELWSIIIDYVGDWELAQNLGIYTTLPTPSSWVSILHQPISQLSWPANIHLSILTNNLREISRILNSSMPPPAWLPKQSVTLILRLALVPTLRHLERHHQDLFWNSFGHALVPDKASAVFGRVELLEYWRTSPSFLTKEYSTEAVDGASKAGFLDVLEWWLKSGLPLKFTESALEQASSRGHIEVLEWWKSAANTSEAPVTTSSTSTRDGGPSPLIGANDGDRPIIRLKPGKSIAYATQAGALPTLKWWASAGIPFAHEDSVAKHASDRGHVAVLTFWHALRGEKMLFDDSVLVGPTLAGHVDVLEWWRKSGLRVEYKTCDIEEALEDGVQGVKGQEVRGWWARNGLNLGVGTSEWMKSKVLG